MERTDACTHREDAVSVTAEIESHESELASPPPPGTSIARLHLTVASVFLILGALIGAIAALQLVVPDLLSGIAFTTYGRLAPAARVLLADGWLVLGLLGASYVALARVTGSDVRRRPVALASLALIALGAAAGALGILLGFQSGIVGQEAPVWARLISFLGYGAAAIAVASTARTAKDSLGATGWYLTAAPIWLALSGLVAVLPSSAGIPGVIQMAFANAGAIGLFAVTASVGLLYYVFTSITETDPTEARPLSTLGFWSLTLVWANLAAVHLIYSPTPDWYETLAVAFAIAALIPVLTIAGDLGLMLRGRVGEITDRGSLRYGMVSALSLVTATVVLLLLSWRATSAIVQFSTWVNGLDLLIVLGGGTFAIFATASVMRGGRSGGTSLHLFLSTIGLLAMTAGLLVSGVIVGFSWAAGPASQSYVNAGSAWRITVESSQGYLWLSALGLLVFLMAQILYVAAVDRGRPAATADLATVDAYDLEFEGPPRYATWRRLMTGVAAVWLFAGLMTWLLPVLDDTDREATILADASRIYPEGSLEAIGRQVYISEGCMECHTQQVRPIGTDVGLGPVSIAGDYAHEQPALLGTYRFGPDLMHYAGQVDFFDPIITQAKLEEPRTVVPWSTKPSYSYLSGDDLEALVSYIETLR